MGKRNFVLGTLLTFSSLGAGGYFAREQLLEWLVPPPAPAMAPAAPGASPPVQSGAITKAEFLDEVRQMIGRVGDDVEARQKELVGLAVHGEHLLMRDQERLGIVVTYRGRPYDSTKPESFMVLADLTEGREAMKALWARLPESERPAEKELMEVVEQAARQKTEEVYGRIHGEAQKNFGFVAAYTLPETETVVNQATSLVHQCTRRMLHEELAAQRAKEQPLLAQDGETKLPPGETMGNFLNRFMRESMDRVRSEGPSR